MNDKPTKVDDADRIKMQLLGERARRIVAETQVTQGALQKLMQERFDLEGEQAGFAEEMKQKYGLEMKDQVNLTSGDITRAPAEAPVIAHGLRAMPKAEQPPPAQ